MIAFSLSLPQESSGNVVAIMNPRGVLGSVCEQIHEAMAFCNCSTVIDCFFIIY